MSLYVCFISIEEELGSDATYAGADFRKAHEKAN